MDLEFSDSIPAFWFDDNPMLSSLLGALSVAFPPGERYFIESVRHYLPLLVDPELRKQVRAFAGQEANHTKEHLAFNRFLDRMGYPATAMERYATKRIGAVQRSSTPEENLARTAALEHFTAILAGAFLEHPEVLDRMSPEVATLWAWHAIEEIEHRAVAFDVYKEAVDDEALRIRKMVESTVVFIGITAVRTVLMMHATRTLRDVRSSAKGLFLLWGRPGVLRAVVPRYLAYYRRDFHPSQHDHFAALERAKARYLGAA